MTLENPEKIHETCIYLLFGFRGKSCEEKPHQTPLGPKIPIQGCSEEWKFEAEAPEGIAEERSSVFFGEKDSGRWFFCCEKIYTQKKIQKRFLVWGLM